MVFVIGRRDEDFWTSNIDVLEQFFYLGLLIVIEIGMAKSPECDDNPEIEVGARFVIKKGTFGQRLDFYSHVFPYVHDGGRAYIREVFADSPCCGRVARLDASGCCEVLGVTRDEVTYCVNGDCKRPLVTRLKDFVEHLSRQELDKDER